jgi:hypothetical protein
MEIVFISIMFLAPGLLIDTLDERLHRYKKPIKKRTAYHVLFAIIANSVIVFGVTMVLINLAAMFLNLSLNPIVSLSELIKELDRFQILVPYVILMVIVSLLWLLVLNTVGKKAFNKIVNKYLFKEASVIENEQSIWEEIFFPKLGNDEKRNWIIASFYKDGKHLVSGYMARHSGDDRERHDYQILHSDVIESILERESETPIGKRIIGPVYMDYLDHESGILIRLYRCNEKRLDKEIKKHQGNDD